jgi:hypothetical protein
VRILRRQLVTIAIGAGIASPLAPAAFAQDGPKVEAFPLQDASHLIARDVKIDAVEYLGRKAVRLTASTGQGFAQVAGTDFQDGTIEVDIATKIIAPPGARMPGFVGVAFRARPDASHFELFYLRPGNADADDQAMHNHVVQYTAEPDFGWYQLRRVWPWAYEGYADIALETWTHVKIEVAGRAARLYLNNASRPALAVEGLKGEYLRGVVALWSYPAEEAYFSNLRITNSTPEPVKNGSDAAGAWHTTLTTDTGTFAGQLELRRDGATLTGTWSGALGDHRAVTGQWRDGYVEIQFIGEWPKALPGGAAPAPVTLAGWVDGATAKGRVAIGGRADGVWTATK